MKHNCPSCCKNYKNTVKNYETNGNFCPKCSTKCFLISELRKHLRKDEPNKKKINELLEKLKPFSIGLTYVLKSQKQIDAMSTLLKL
jgi:predicted  nucleic acid-binding Zn-ribbon protein